MRDKMYIDIVTELKRLNIISWYSILMALEKEWITKKDVESYAVFLLSKPHFYNDNVAVLANADFYSEREVKDSILQIALHLVPSCHVIFTNV